MSSSTCTNRRSRLAGEFGACPPELVRDTQRPRRLSRLRAWIALGAFAPGLLVASAAHAATLTVCKTGCSATNIQAAVDAANNGDTVEVRRLDRPYSE